jgi:imidazole glycerol-phosphate synthase subunit HisH
VTAGSRQTLALIDYGSGNLRSAAKALERAGADAGLSLRLAVTSDPDAIARADRIVLPGVGAFGQCITALSDAPGLRAALDEAVIARGQPFLGICVGMQLMATRGLEHGEYPGLGWLSGEVVRLTPTDAKLKIPHMGWNEVRFTDTGRRHPALAALPDAASAYFVHSYHMAHSGSELAIADYAGPVAAIVGRDNLLGTQFHPEKSQAFGLGFLAAFLRWNP